ncbi:VlmB-like protein [Streptacidiphilus sp. ASG 303]|uniref:VlmB-like protein n=1 Tax=Streptacidiphilus sp. ASG 303 TaxID=2896847 RepID=UPI001E28A115|nr:VlmB-like protein [Streptacidiphilus sp. ASG 303]MCD0484725.1 VlmB-like protein [Streptacidiphilus sp. ASG 303]
MSEPAYPPEADWESAPSLVDGAMNLELTAASCNLQYWLRAVPQGTLRGRVLGHAEDAGTLDVVRRPGPFNDALTQELAFRSMAEEKATRAISYLVALAPDNDCMEFYATQLMDEARHAMVFRSHLPALGVAPHELEQEVERLAGADRDRVLVPLEELGLRVLRDEGDFIGGVVVLTVLVEGVLAPAAELSERKWRVFDPAASEIERGAGIDEIRHLTVGSSIAREYLLKHPEEKPRILALVRDGMRLWAELPSAELVHRREVLFQQGLEEHGALAGDYEVWPGRRLVDTTAEERERTAHEWAGRMQRARLAYMGLEEAL